MRFDFIPEFDEKAYQEKARQMAELEKRERMQKLEDRLKASGLTLSEYQKLKDWRFLIFKYQGGHTKHIKGKALEWLKGGYKKAPFLILYGNKGTGKTTLAKKLGILFMSRTNIYFLPKTIFDLKAYDFNNLENFLNDLMEVGLLILDDLGVGKDTDYKFSQLYTVLDYRYMNDKPTIITTNLDLKKAAAGIDETTEKGHLKEFALLVDRFQEKGLFLKFDYPSLRSPEALKAAKAGDLTKFKPNPKTDFNF